jgi:hypothetical protein
MSGAADTNTSSRWRSSNQTQNHAKAVLDQHKKALAAGLKPKMPPSPAPNQAGKQTVAASNPFKDGFLPPSGPPQASAATNL